MVAAVRTGESFRSVANRFHVGVATVHHWFRRARHQCLDQVEWNDRPPIAQKVSRIPLEVGRRFSDPIRLESGWTNLIEKENRRGATIPDCQ